MTKPKPKCPRCGRELEDEALDEFGNPRFKHDICYDCAVEWLKITHGVR